MSQIVVEEIIEQRDVDAGLYLLTRMLRLPDLMSPKKYSEMAAIYSRIADERQLHPYDREYIVASYHEVIG